MNNKFELANGDCINFGDDYILCLENLENNLCPSNYNSSIKCFWEGNLVGHFSIKFPHKIKRFVLSTRDLQNEIPKSISLKTPTGKVDIKIDGFNAGKSENSAKIKLNINFVSNEEIFTVKKGEFFSINLEGNVSTGYSWIVDTTNGLKIYDIKPELLGNNPGSSTNFIYIFEATKKGMQEINGIYRRSWKSITGNETKYHLKVNVI